MLIERLLEKPQQFNFYQAVRILAQSDGYGNNYDDALEDILPIRFFGNSGLQFFASDIAKIDKQANEKLPKYRMYVNFLSLYGSVSPLPDHYSEDILFEGEDTTLRHFLDLFNHRLISLHYQAWLKYRWFFKYQAGAKDKFSQHMLAIAGIRQVKGHNSTALEWERLLPFVGLLSLRVTTHGILARIIQGYFGLSDVYIEENVSDDIEIDAAQKVRLGVRNSILGVNLSIGNRVRNISGKFRIHLRSLNLKQFHNFMRGGEFHPVLHQLVNTVLREPLRFDCLLELGVGEVPPMKLCGEFPQGLGRDTWIGQPNTLERIYVT